MTASPAPEDETGLPSREALLDEALEASFPASDPIAILRREEDQ